jgi:hypothetical protein
MEQEPKLNPKIEKPELDMALLEQQVSLKIEQYKKLPIMAKAFELLEKLPNNLTYHGKKHTDDVLHEAILFGTLDGLNDQELERLAVASVWHDVGFIDRPNENEEIAIKYFLEANKNSPVEYTKDIENMILDTTVRKTDKGFQIILSNPISAHLLDADVSNFGRPDFWKKRQEIVEERKVNWEDKKERLEFLKSTLAFIKNHDWHTQVARSLRQEQKAKNLANMEKEIASLE